MTDKRRAEAYHVGGYKVPERSSSYSHKNVRYPKGFRLVAASADRVQEKEKKVS